MRWTSRVIAWLLRVGASLSAATLATMGVLKICYAPDFYSALQSWRVLPAWAVPALLVSVPLLEVTVAGAWLFNLHRRVCSIVIVTFLIVATGLYGIEAASAGPPRCGCAGMSAAWIDNPWAVLLRNGAMLLFHLWTCWSASPCSRSS